MSGLRRHLARFVALWLVCQSASLLAAPLALAQLSSQAAVGDEECHCPGVGPGQVCPMHHKQRPAKPTCRMCGASDSGEVALVVLTVGLGILAPTPGTPVISPRTESIAATAVSTVARAERPDAPPPRS
jgi:hypothetical protein